MTVSAKHYEPQDQMHIFWMQEPTAPRLVGTLNLNPRLKGANFEYAAQWLKAGISLSADLPLRTGEFLPQPEHLPGAVDDARPDRWGERVIRHIDAPKRLSILEYLFFAGDDRFGALGVSLQADRFVPCASEPAPRLSDIHAIYDLIQAIEAGQPVDPGLARLIRPGATLGGAKPKALIDIDGQSHLVKFPERDEIYDVGLVEHATMTLAHKAGLGPAHTRPINLGASRGHAIAITRFDRAQVQGLAVRLHAVSMRTALNSVEAELSYGEFALYLRRFAPTDQAQLMAETLFRRMVFNILMDNTDDHEKNHAVVIQPDGTQHLAPAFDILPSCQNLGYQQIVVGPQGSESTLTNAMNAHKSFRLTKQAAERHVQEVATVVDSWQEHFAATGVSEKDIEVLQSSIDRQFLRSQRQIAMQKV